MTADEVLSLFHAHGLHISDGVDSCSGEDHEAMRVAAEEFADKLVSPNLEKVLNALASEWQVCRRPNGKYEVEALFRGDDGWSRCGEQDTIDLAVRAIARLLPPSRARLFESL